MSLSFSIVINTLNRGPSLQRTLESLRWLKYRGEFEVIVVNGPSSDHSDEVIASWLPAIRAGKCAVPNLSISRNIGICMARGDIVAFIDDDAIPEPEWLSQLAAAYASAEIGAAGGFVFDHTGYRYQYRYANADRLGNAKWAEEKPAEQFCFPESFEFPYLQGTNASFRRSVLLEVGGFDEEFEYYLDETDVCCRIVDAGYLIRQLPHAYVHHQAAPNEVRDENRITRNRYPIIKNKIYFSLKHGRNYLPLRDIVESNKRFSRELEAEVVWHIADGRMDAGDEHAFHRENQKAWDRATSRGLLEFRDMITAEKVKRWAGEFRGFPALVSDASKTIVLVSRDYPPNHSGGIATFVKELAEALAAQGHLVHVITQAADGNRVAFERGVWLHYVPVTRRERQPQAVLREIPHAIWDWSVAAFDEACRIATHRTIDVVEAPIWDCEGAAFMLDGRWPLVTSLQTTLHFWMESQPDLCNDAQWMASFGKPMLRLERELMTQACAVRASSRAIVQAVESAYGFSFDSDRLKLIPYGMTSSASVTAQTNEAHVEVLFVGRFEARKGIDVLLDAIPGMLRAEPNLTFRLVGDDTLAAPGGGTYKEAFLARHAHEDWLERVRFCGRVSDADLRQAYAECDIFVAPSRFESFGLVFLEAMREGKPVIGCAIGGVLEVVADEADGILVEPGNASALAQAVLRLTRDSVLRAGMGQAGGRKFEQQFSAARMARMSAELYQLAMEQSSCGAELCH